MRKDFGKVLTEPARRGQGDNYRLHRGFLKNQIRQIESLREYDSDIVESGHTGMRKWASREIGWDRKHRSYNYRAAKRFLLSRVGKRWDDVWAEINSVLDQRDPRLIEFWEDMKRNVEQKTHVHEDGTVWYADDHHRWRTVGEGNYYPITDSFAAVYVDPNDGCIYEIPKTSFKRRKVAKPAPFVEIDKWHQAHYFKGAWYLIELAPNPPHVWKPWTSDQIERYEKELATNSSRGYFYSYGSTSELREYNRCKVGRWVQAPYRDVAEYDISESLGLRDSWGWNHRYGARKAKGIYGREGVYAKRRWQMNTAELIRYGLKPVDDSEPEIIE